MGLPFSGLDAIIAAVTAGQVDLISWSKLSTAPIAVGVWHSTWAENGSPAAGAVDAGGTQYVMGSGGSGSSANTGGLKFATTAVSGSGYGRIATEFSAASSAAIANVILADRLCAIGPITVTSTGSKTLTTLPALPRYTNGIGVEVWLEVTTAFTVTAGTFFLDSYTGTTNAGGSSATNTRLATAISATIKVGDMIGPFPLLPPDVGVKAVASFYVNAAPTAGAVNVVLLKRLPTLVPIPFLGGANSRNLISQIPSMPQIYDGAALQVMWQAGTAAASNLVGDLVAVYG